MPAAPKSTSAIEQASERGCSRCPSVSRPDWAGQIESLISFFSVQKRRCRQMAASGSERFSRRRLPLRTCPLPLNEPSRNRDVVSSLRARYGSAACNFCRRPSMQIPCHGSRRFREPAKRASPHVDHEIWKRRLQSRKDLTQCRRGGFDRFGARTEPPCGASEDERHPSAESREGKRARERGGD